MVETAPQFLARRAFGMFPRLAGIPVFTGAEILDIRGEGRVEQVVIRSGGETRTFDCDGLLLTGQFTPEATLFQTSSMNVDRASRGPAVDQFGRCLDPTYFAAGNILRPVETGGWSFREGRAIGRAIADDLRRETPTDDIVPISFSDPIKLVVPNMLRRQPGDAALRFFQLRVARHIRGRLILELDGRIIWDKKSQWLPERRILVPLPATALTASSVHLAIEEF